MSHIPWTMLKEAMRAQKVSHSFIEDEVLDSDGDNKLSDAFDARDFRKMLLYVQIVETGDPADSTVQIVVKHCDTEDGVYKDLQNGPFGFMLWEEDAIPSGTTGLVVATVGDCVGKYMKVYIVARVGVTLNAANYFKVTVKADFMA